jgi:hypothetical protein
MVSRTKKPSCEITDSKQAKERNLSRKLVSFYFFFPSKTVIEDPRKTHKNTNYA